MKHSIWYGLLVIVVIASLAFVAACAQPAPAPTPTPKPSPTPTPTTAPAPSPTPAPYKWPAEFKFTSSAIGSTSNTLLSALGPAIQKGTGMPVRVVPEDNIALKARWIASGQYDATDQSSGEVAPYCIQGSGAYLTKDGGPYPVRAVFYLYDQVFGCFVKGDSGINTIADLKGKRVAQWQTTGADDTVKAVLAFGNLTINDVTIVPIASYPAQVDAVPEGKADAAFIALPSMANVQKAAAAPGGIKWFDLNGDKDPAAAARFNQYLPVHALMPITSDPNNTGALGKYGWGSAGMVWTRAAEDATLVYNLVKWLDENYNSFKDLQPQLKELNAKNLRSFMNWTYLPIHEGTVKYFKEKNMWTADDDVRQKYNVDLVNAYVAAYKDCLKQADAKGLNIDPQNKDWTTFWTDYKKSLGIPTFKVIRNTADIKTAQATLDPILKKLGI